MPSAAPVTDTILTDEGPHVEFPVDVKRAHESYGLSNSLPGAMNSGVLATTTAGGPALLVDGVSLFTRSGVPTIAIPPQCIRSSQAVTVDLPVGWLVVN